MDIKESAIRLVQVIVERKAKYEGLNDAIKQVQGRDFPSHQHAMDDEIESSVVRLLDEIFDGPSPNGRDSNGDGTASYFIYELTRTPHLRFIIEADGTKWPLVTIDDLRAYANRTIN